ncbi:hypothetical protein [Kosakonia cowanii]|uniref:hypothetical protein n=1 Tax=Kosakonia cowanii TaxID=208223 RepID=UPI003D98CCA3
MDSHDPVKIVFTPAHQFWRAFAYVMQAHENHYIKRAGVAGIRVLACCDIIDLSYLGMTALWWMSKMIKDKLCDNKIRVLYTAIFVIVMVFAWIGRSFILNDTSRFNLLGYMGTVVTILGLIITFLEVMHGVVVSKSLHKQASEMLGHFKDKEFELLMSELVTVLDYLISDVDDKSFTIALRQLSSFYRIHKRVKSNYIEYYGRDDADVIDKINNIEKNISALRYTKQSAMIPNKVMIDLNDGLIDVKRFFVSKQSELGGSKNAAS